MPFSNAGAGRPILYVDYWHWNSISGEPYAPTLTGASYSSSQGYSAYAGVSGNTVQFPYLPRIGLNQSAAGTLTFTWWMLHTTNGSVASNFYPFGNSGALANVWFSNTILNYTTGNKSVNVAKRYSSPPSLNTWHKYVWTFNIAGTTTLTIDGTVPALTSGSLPDTCDTYPTDALHPYWTPNVAGTQYLYGLDVEWS